MRADGVSQTVAYSAFAFSSTMITCIVIWWSNVLLLGVWFVAVPGETAVPGTVFCMPKNAPVHPALSSITKSIPTQGRIPDRIQDCDCFLSDIIYLRNDYIVPSLFRHFDKIFIFHTIHPLFKIASKTQIDLPFRSNDVPHLVNCLSQVPSGTLPKLSPLKPIAARPNGLRSPAPGCPPSRETRPAPGL